MTSEIVYIDPDRLYVFNYKYAGHNLDFKAFGAHLITDVFKAYETLSTRECNEIFSPTRDYEQAYGDIKQELKQLHVALSRAIEEGDNLKLGIVLGQSISKIESLINE
jgi:hypothetical protein